MKPEEADKIIAEFMGLKHNMPFVSYKDSDTIVSVEYSQSLDALVPVWKKLNLFSVDIQHIHNSYCDVLIWDYEVENCFEHQSKSISQAAAIATAKAILELSRDSKAIKELK